MKRNIITFILISLSFNLMGQYYLNNLKDSATFNKYSGLPLVEKYGQVSAIKVVYDTETKEIFYINARHFDYHHEFCLNILDPELDLSNFNEINYSDDPDRKYLLANINYYESLNIYALEITPVDLMKKDDIILLWNNISKSSFIGDSLHLFVNSIRLQSISSSIESILPILSPSEIYKNLNYQAISKYKGFGNLRFIKDLKSEESEIKPMDIIVLNETPLVLPKVAGIIINEFQTPLSHITILGQNRQIPICAYKSAFEDSTLLKLKDKKVRLIVYSEDFRIKEVDKIKTKKSKRRSIKLEYNLNVDSLVSVSNFTNETYKYSGNKANNFGILNKLSNELDFKVPEGAFAIPFYFYNQHIENSIAKNLIDSLLSNKSNIHNSDSLRLILKTIRKAIKDTPIAQSLSSSVNTKVIKNKKWTSMRFRSSTNAEDAKGFSGAGLYSSKTGILNDNKKTFEKAIKKIWASLWSYEAYTEREYYNIDHNMVYMGILVHRSFPNEEVNGVVISKNIYRKDDYGFVINAQLGNESIVKPNPGIVNDQFICFPNTKYSFYKDKKTVDIITQSSLNNNKLVMSETEIQNLANIIEAIKKYYFKTTYTTKSYIEFGLDIEFKLEENNRDLYIKQIRVYND